MYDFLYNYIKKTYGSSAAWPKAGDRAKLLFTDTNSLLYEIATEDFYKDISGDVEDKLDTITPKIACQGPQMVATRRS